MLPCSRKHNCKQPWPQLHNYNIHDNNDAIFNDNDNNNDKRRKQRNLSIFSRLYYNEKRPERVWQEPPKPANYGTNGSNNNNKASIAPTTKQQKRTHSIYSRLYYNEKRPEPLWHDPATTITTNCTITSSRNRKHGIMKKQMSRSRSPVMKTRTRQPINNSRTRKRRESKCDLTLPTRASTIRRTSRSTRPKRTVNSIMTATDMTINHHKDPNNAHNNHKRRTCTACWKRASRSHSPSTISRNEHTHEYAHLKTASPSKCVSLSASPKRNANTTTVNHNTTMRKATSRRRNHKGNNKQKRTIAVTRSHSPIRNCGPPMQATTTIHRPKRLLHLTATSHLPPLSSPPRRLSSLNT